MTKIKIDEFVDSMDYARIQTVMNSLDWGYRGASVAPSIEELESTARYVINHALDNNSDRVSTGGFVFHNTPTYKELCFRLDGMEEWGIKT